MKAVKKDPPRKPIVVTNPNDPRLKAYNDSLSLYKRGTEKVRYWRNNPNATNSELNKSEVEIDRRFPVSKSSYLFGDKIIQSVDMERTGSGQSERMVPQYKKPVQPVVFSKEVTKANVAPKELTMPKPSIKVQKTVKLPSAIRYIGYEGSANVLLDLDGTNRVMSRKDFTTWVNKPENRKMFDDYRKAKAKK